MRGSRDLRLDFLRGFCLLRMVFFHGLPTPLHLPVARIGFLAAEGFFFISGTVLGLVYRKRLAQVGLPQCARALLRRALFLWLANFALVVLYSAWDFSGRKWGFYHLGYTYKWVFWGDWHWYSLLSFDQPYFLQILPRYAVFLALSPVALWLLERRRWWVVLGASWTIYLLEQVPNVDLMIPFLEHGRADTGFRHSAWQALFFTGLVVGYERDRLGWLWQRLTRPWALLALAVIGGGALLMQYAFTNDWLPISQQLGNKLFARDVIALGRLPSIAAVFVLTFWAVTLLWRPLSASLGWLLLPMGQNALVAFLVHIPLIHAALSASKLGWLGTGGGWGVNLVVDLLMIAIVWSVAMRLSRRKRGRAKPHAGTATFNAPLVSSDAKTSVAPAVAPHPELRDAQA
jgi:hypothetical protein